MFFLLKTKQLIHTELYLARRMKIQLWHVIKSTLCWLGKTRRLSRNHALQTSDCCRFCYITITNCPLDRTSRVTCSAQCNVKMWIPLFKNHYDFKMAIAKHYTTTGALQDPRGHVQIAKCTPAAERLPGCSNKGGNQSRMLIVYTIMQGMVNV